MFGRPACALSEQRWWCSVRDWDGLMLSEHGCSVFGRSACALRCWATTGVATNPVTNASSAPLSCSVPAITASAAGPTDGVATVTPPANNRPWASYDLRVCVNGTADCRTVPCTANASADATTSCPIPSCVPATTYSVAASAKQAGHTSRESAAATFTTDAWP